MLLGINPDEMMAEDPLVAWNSDVAKEEEHMWPYPPVMLLEAAHDFEWYAGRMKRTVDFFKRQASHCHRPHHVWHCTTCLSDGLPPSARHVLRVKADGPLTARMSSMMTACLPYLFCPVLSSGSFVLGMISFVTWRVLGGVPQLQHACRV